MSMPLTVECQVEVRRSAKGRKQLAEASPAPQPLVPPGRVPYVSRWLALALRCDQLLREGHIKNYSALGRLGHVTHARISQIMNLLYLAPDIQEAILFLPRTVKGRDPITLRDLQPIAAVLNWREQRRRWQQLLASKNI